MNLLIEKHKNFLRTLLDYKVKFILVGGYAVIYHGYIRSTGDMDIWLQPNNENKNKVIDVLKVHGFSKDSMMQLSNVNFTDTIAFHFGNPPERIDFMTQIAGLKFDEAYAHAEKFEVRDFYVPVLKLNDLILNKLLTNRLKDKADVEELQKILKQRKGF